MDTTDFHAVEQQSIDYSDEEFAIIPNRAADLWFEDGNVVLETESTQFRVHRSILSTHSVIFRDMFAAPQPAAFEEELEGCQVVLLPDSAEDWTHVLKALYDRSYQFDDDKPQTFSVVAAFARLGTKYDFRQLRNEAVKRLTFMFPSRLEDMGNIHIEGNCIIAETGLIFEAINLARETNMLFLLPAAMEYCCAVHTIHDILNGVQRPNKTPIFLSVEDQTACLSGWYELIHRQAEETYRWLDRNAEGTLFPECQRRSRCTDGRRRIFYSMSHPVTCCVPLEPWQGADWEKHMCATCNAASQAQHERGRQNVWNELPSFFGLPGWDELLKA